MRVRNWTRLGILSLLCYISGTHLGSSQSRVGAVYASGERVEAQFEFQAPRPLPEKQNVWLVEDGVGTISATDIKTARDMHRGLWAVVAIDVSRSMKGAPLTEAREALGSQLAAFSPQDSVSVVSFANETKVECAPGPPQRPDMASAIGRLVPRGSHTILYDAVAECINQLSKVPGRRRRVLVISDGMDEGSKLQIGDVSQRAQQNGVSIDAVGHGKVRPDEANSLYRLAKESGGLYAYAKPGEMSASLKTMLDQIESMPVAIFERKLNPSGAKTRNLALQIRSPGSAPEVSKEVEMAIPSTMMQSASSPYLFWLPIVGAVLAVALLVILVSRRRKGPVAATPPQAEQRQDLPAEPIQPIAPRPHRQKTVVDRSFLETPPRTASAIALSVIAGPARGRTAVVPPGTFRIGAAGDNDFPIMEDEYVSAHHAQIDARGGGFVIEDSGSKGGTYVNGQRIAGARSLRSGDIIKVGRSELQVDADAEVTEDPIR